LIIDSSAIVAIFFHESGAEEILATIVAADFAGIGSPTAAETGLVLTSALGENATGSLLRFFEESGIEGAGHPSRSAPDAQPQHAGSGHRTGFHPAGPAERWSAASSRDQFSVAATSVGGRSAPR